METDMKRINKLHRLLTIILFAGLSACRASLTTPTATLTPILPTFTQTALTPTSTAIPFTVIPSPLPTKPIIPVITPDASQVERWQEYQNALAKSVLSLRQQRFYVSGTF
jgi:hypothetical protein